MKVEKPDANEIAGELLFEQSRLPKFRRGLSCLCWAYNEHVLIADFLVKLNETLRDAAEDYEIVVVDDSSTDGTGEIIRELQKDIPQIVIVKNRINRNVGVAFQRAIRAASKEFLFWQTIDWAYNLTFLRLYLELMSEFDIVAGTRSGGIPSILSANKKLGAYGRFFSKKHLLSRSDTIPKALVSIVNYFLIRLLFGVPLTDYQNVCIYRRELIQSFQYESRSSFSNPEGLIKGYWGGAKIVEVPIEFLARTQGEAKGTKPQAILRAVRDIFQCWFQWNLVHRVERSSKTTIVRLNYADLAKKIRRFDHG